MLTSGVVAAVILAIPTFIFRKLVNGLYNVFIRPFVDSKNDKEFNEWRFLRGIANVFTLGLFSVMTKIFKAITGYSHQFGFTTDDTQMKFRDASHHAAVGGFETDSFGKLRVFLRTFYGFRHTSETIVKAYHKAYLDYAGANQVSCNINGFFASKECKSAGDNMKINEDEKFIDDEVRKVLTSGNNFSPIVKVVLSSSK